MDSEGPVAQGAGPWAHLRARDGWIRPADATDENAHLMVQCMETWFLADRDNLADYFGHGFNPNALPAREEIEEGRQGRSVRGAEERYPPEQEG